MFSCRDNDLFRFLSLGEVNKKLFCIVNALYFIENNEIKI